MTLTPQSHDGIYLVALYQEEAGINEEAKSLDGHALTDPPHQHAQLLSKHSWFLVAGASLVEVCKLLLVRRLKAEL